MKVILTQEVKGRGGEGDVIEVARGFAVNYLFPRKLALEATSGNLKQLEARQGNIRKREGARMGDAQAIADVLQGKKVTIGAKVGDEGRLYGSITNHMIEGAIAEQLDVDVDRRKIDVHGHIKELGEHVVSVQVYRDIYAEVTVRVVAEGQVESTLEALEAVEAEIEAEEAKTVDADAEADEPGDSWSAEEADTREAAEAPEDDSVEE
ncbi:MAG: 50S ribosomal protein L9 [Actinomycetota bacterium]|nr:50S ribosomal protein L9 [Actinomycetota bacterium]